MATSNSTDFSQNRDQIITRSLRILNVIADGETPSSEMVSNCSVALNAMIKTWVTKGVSLWVTDEAVLHLTKGQVKYDLGSTSADHATRDADAVKTELSADAVAGATSLSVDSITDISNGDEIGVELDDGTIHWTTVNGAPSGSTVVITAGLASAAATDNHVYVYTTDLPRPLRVWNPRRRGADGNDVPIISVSRNEYFETPNKTAEGKSTMVYYDPQLTLGELYLWQAPDDVQDRILFSASFHYEDFDAAANDPHFPQEWINPITWCLAEELATEYSVPEAIWRRVQLKSAQYKVDVLGFDQEPESVYFSPAMVPWAED
jgi:hypothetical protein